jgi:hypothetical protein
MPATSPTPSGGTGAAAMPRAAALQCAQRLVRLNTLSGQSNLALSISLPWWRWSRR